MRRQGAAVLAAAVASLAAGGAYARWLQPRHDRWGATDGEVAVALPGDELVPDPATQNTRAITIDAPPHEVWPWLAQIGADRAGFYSYDVLEDLFGLGIHSADHIVDEWQDLKEGDVVYASRRRTGGWYVVTVHPGSLLVLQTADLARGRPILRTDPGGWEYLWTFALIDRGDSSTRLLVRERVAFGNRLVRVLMTPAGPVSFLMTRRMLIGIKQRSERARLNATDVGRDTRSRPTMKEVAR